jgi:hypothetical protein
MTRRASTYMLNIARLRTGDEAADDLRCPSAQARVS